LRLGIEDFLISKVLTDLDLCFSIVRDPNM